MQLSVVLVASNAAAQRHFVMAVCRAVLHGGEALTQSSYLFAHLRAHMAASNQHLCALYGQKAQPPPWLPACLHNYARGGQGPEGWLLHVRHPGVCSLCSGKVIDLQAYLW